MIPGRFMIVAALCCVACGAFAEDLRELRVSISSKSDIQRLIDAGFDVDHPTRSEAVVYAAESTVSLLRGIVPIIEDKSYAAFERSAAKATAAYHDYEGVERVLRALVTKYPAYCRLETIGQSVQDRELWVLIITAPGDSAGRPKCKIVGGIHGDEPIGVEFSLFLAKRLLEGRAEVQIAAMLSGLEVWVMPSVNPDGLEYGTRYNAHGVDLNRAFPLWPKEFPTVPSDMDKMNTAKREPEVAAVMQWCRDHSFALSAGLHAGAQVVNYPYDDDGEPSGVETPTPDDDLMRYVATAYAAAVPALHDNEEFPGGITNGTKWYAVWGGMQDWNYRYAGCNDFTIELNNTKAPSADRLAGLWAEHQAGMLAFVDCARLLSASGKMMPEVEGEPFSGRVRLNQNPHIVYADPDTGWYARMTLTANPTLLLQARGWLQQTSDVSPDSITLASADINGDEEVNVADLVLATGQNLPAGTIQNLVNQILGRQ